MRRLLSSAWKARLGGRKRTRARQADDTALPLYDIYEDTFELVRADTAELREASHRLRYQVYCVEEPFENPAENPGGLEKDIYDQRSIHSLLIHRKSGMLVGNVRIVLPDRQGSDPSISFPLQNVTQIDALTDPDHVRWSCEISRFCISKNFRKRDTDNLYTGVFLRNHMNPLSLFKPHHQQRVIPFTALGLVRAIFEMAIEHEKVWGYAMLEPPLIRLLAKLGITCKVLGEPAMYHGKRYPVEMNPLKICISVKHKHPEIWKVLTNNGAIVERMEALVAKYRGELAASGKKTGRLSVMRGWKAWRSHSGSKNTGHN